MEIFSESMQEKLVNEIVKLAEKIAVERIKQKEKAYLSQKEIMKEYNLSHEQLKNLEIKGLAKFKLGKRLIYNRYDLEKLFDKLKS